MLRDVWLVINDVSEQPIRPIFKGHEVQEKLYIFLDVLTIEPGADRLFWNVGD
jgi:hypothetical protein